MDIWMDGLLVLCGFNIVWLLECLIVWIEYDELYSE